jgi:transposase
MELNNGINYMGRTSKLLTQEVLDLAESNLEKLGRSGVVAIKLRAIISAHKNGITGVAKVFGTTKATLISWIKHVKNGSLDLLNVQKGRGPKNILTESHQNMIKEWMINDSQITINKIKQNILLETGIDVGRSTVHRVMKALNFSYITPRPKHYKQSPDALPEAKKKSSITN